MRSPLFILIAAFTAALLVSQWLGGGLSARPSTPAALIDAAQRFFTQHPGLGVAIAEADRGEPARLVAWVNEAPAPDRQRLVQVLHGLVFAEAGLDPTGSTMPPIQLFYPHRHRFAAFTHLRVGIEAIDQDLDNLLGYLHVAGSSTPTADDLAVGKHLLPAIERLAIEHGDDHPRWDTVGCIRFVHGEWPAAIDAFATAIRLAEAAPTNPDAVRSLPLYRQRLAAATANRDLATDAPANARQLLPLETAAVMPQTAER